MGTRNNSDLVELASQADWDASSLSRSEFIALMREQAPVLYRDLPWRGIDDAYAVWVSEVMLQQTQVVRVLDYWEKWLSMFPTVEALAAADTATVLDAWQGLGYNRRALALQRACSEISAAGGMIPRTEEELVALPGIGSATAAGIIAFAYNRPAVYLETNVRSVFLHYLFPDKNDVSDKELIPYIADTCPEDDPRTWYYGLLDIGAHLKSQGINPSRRSKHHTRQSKFEGSHREKRSWLLKEVLAQQEGIHEEEALQALNDRLLDAKRDPLDPADFEALVEELTREGFFRREDGLLIP